MSTSNTERKVWYLRRLDLFLSLTDWEIEEIARALDDHYIPAGAELLHDRQRERIYIIKTGAIRLYTDERGQQTTLALLGPGRMFGLSSRFGNTNLIIGAITLEPSYICFATLPKMLECFSTFPQLMMRMMEALGEQIFMAETWVERAASLSPRVRLANLLLDLCDQFCESHEDGLRIRFRLTQSDLARMLGVARETVSRIMADFTRAGWVTNKSGLLLIHNRDALQNVVHGLE
jgi:CRP-like cAMP-binding protein